MKQVTPDMRIMLLLKVLIPLASIIYVSSNKADELVDFECAFPITEGRQSVRAFMLTEDVYKCLKYSGHRDLVVVNSDQQIVPFRVSAPAQKRDVKTFTKDFAFYHEPAAASYKTGDQIRRIADLTGVVSGDESDSQWLDKNTFYSSLILEQKKSDDVLKSITIHKKVGATPVSVTVIIESSDDLQRWTTLHNPMHILYLPGTKNNLQSNVLKISTSRAAKYLRLATLSNIEDFTAEITSITGEYEASTYTTAPLLWSSVGTLHPIEETGAWLMPLGDLRPVSHIRFSLAEDIVFYQGAIYTQPHINPDVQENQRQARRDAKRKIKTLIKNAVHDPHVPRSSAENPWRYVTRFTQYEIYTGTDSVTSSDIRISPIQSKNWKFVFQQPQITGTTRLPKIEIGWRPSQVTFIAQGAGPFQLLAGHSKVPTKPAFPPQLLSLNDNIEIVELVSPASSTDIEPQSTSSQDEPRLFNRNKILLWLTLLIGVVVMATMAYQLSKNMKSGNQ